MMSTYNVAVCRQCMRVLVQTDWDKAHSELGPAKVPFWGGFVCSEPCELQLIEEVSKKNGISQEGVIVATHC